MTYLTFTVPDLRPFEAGFLFEGSDWQSIKPLLEVRLTHLIQFETGFQRWAFEKITGLQIDELPTISIESFKAWRIKEKDVIVFAKMTAPLKNYTRAEYADPNSPHFNPVIPSIEWQTIRLNKRVQE